MNINLTLIGQSIAFLVFVLFCMKIVWPPIIAALNERRQKIADGLAAAERGQSEHKLAEKRATEALREAKGQAAEIIARAEKRSSEIVDEAKSDARAEGDRLLIAAQADVEQETNRAREALRAEVGGLAVVGAERVLGREIDAAAHDKLLDDLIAEL